MAARNTSGSNLEIRGGNSAVSPKVSALELRVVVSSRCAPVIQAMNIRVLLVVASIAVLTGCTLPSVTAEKEPALSEETPRYSKAGVGSRIRKRTTVAPADKMSGDTFQRENNAGRMDLNGTQAAQAMDSR